METSELPLRYDPAISEAYFRTRPVQVASRAVEVFGLACNLGAALFVDDKLGRTEKNRKLRARQTRNLLAALGPTFIKAGQALSIRVDLLPKEYITELRQLQDNVPAFDTAVARKALERELKMPSWRGGVDALFEDFPAEPIAAASLGQVYRTRVRTTGQEVAVKVQRPDMLPGILLDLYLLRKCVPLLKKNKNLNTDLVAVVDEWGVRFVDELDYRREAANATQFGEAMRARGLTSLCTAEVVHGLTSQRVLTTEWVDGTRLDESDKGDEARLCGIALNGYLTMLLDTGVLHADPHPGNLLRTTDGRLCILDFGLVTELTQEQQYSIIEYIAHLISENYIRVPGDLSRLGFVPKGKEAAMDDAGVVRVLAAAFQRLAQGGGAKSLRRSAGVKAKEEGGGVDELGAELKRISEKWGNLFQIPPYFAYILRAFSVLEGIGLQSNPDYAIAQECYPYLARRLFTDDSPRGKAALREMLYGSGEQKALNVTRLTKLSTAAQTFRDTVIESPLAEVEETAAAAVAREAASSSPSGSGRAAASEVANIVLAPNGSYLQELLVKEAARMADVIARDRVKRVGETPVGQLAISAAAAQQQLASSLGPLRPFVMPLPTPLELAEWATPDLTPDDTAVLESSEVLWTLLQPAMARAARSGDVSAPGANVSGLSQEFLEQLPEYAQQYGPGLQRVATSFLEESLRRTALRLNQATRPEVSFPFPPQLVEPSEPILADAQTTDAAL